MRAPVLRRRAAAVIVAAVTVGVFSGCCAAIAYAGEVRIEAPAGTFDEVTEIRLRLCPPGCEEPASVELHRVARDSFIDAECRDPTKCQAHRLDREGSIALSIVATEHEPLDYEIALIHTDGTRRTEAGTAASEKRTIGFPCPQRVTDAVIDLA
ncbi:hypothetical protein JL108_02280 [Aeromicrobium sp. YIM 150415]|uniref:hypothetical protein n=1 Tax=Aeromicrobium sp. YIM 150415 TaxID=2803912 RepID=UPI00196471F5|nr:hypothetical protein [Aeromicrobium sp. YIM 150415]MBM9462257.1 hypothetical protein [Aeromicrobium sp. YIM 150415]